MTALPLALILVLIMTPTAAAGPPIAVEAQDAERHQKLARPSWLKNWVARFGQFGFFQGWSRRELEGWFYATYDGHPAAFLSPLMIHRHLSSAGLVATICGGRGWRFARLQQRPAGAGETPSRRSVHSAPA